MTRTRMSLVATVAVAIGCGVGAVWVRALALDASPKTDPSKGLVVHEWGTLSTFAGSDGRFLKFYPDDRDLPRFVHGRHQYIKGGLENVLVSLETPVLYFYTDKELTASVRVDFPKGTMTDWYPEASRPPSTTLTWENLKVLPKGQSLRFIEGSKSRYYAARETDACSVQVALNNDKKENEKFLFYRGVGDFTMPLTVQALGNGSFQVKNNGKEAIPAFVLLHVQDGKVRFRTHGHLSQGTEVQIEESSEESTAEKLGNTVVELLMQEGLYEKEARAMVKTWSLDWFGEDGVRVLYLAPPPLTDELLPLKIAPKPSSLVRVLVGRHDMFTPEQEREVDALVKKLEGASNIESRIADKALNKLGRYRWPAQNAASARLKNSKAAGQAAK